MSPNGDTGDCPRIIFVGTAVFLLALALYILTLAPTVTLVDSGELIVAARVLGVAHPPGFPLYILLAHLVSLLPLGSIALRVNAASALFGALAVCAAALATLEALLSPGTDAIRAISKHRKQKTPAKNAGPVSSPSTAALLAVLAGLLFCTSRTLWAYATLTEVYTLNTLLIALIFFLMLHWRRLALEGRRNDGFLYAAALAFGLALGVHHVTVGLTLPACAALVLATDGKAFFSGKKLPAAAAFACAGLTVYAYLPLAAARVPIMNWGDPRTLDRFLAHVTGWQYRVYFEAQPRLMGRQFVDFTERLLREFAAPWLPVALMLSVCGFALLWRRSRALFWFLTTAVIVNLLYNINYEIAEDKDAYYLPVFLALVIAAGTGAAWLAGKWSERSRRGLHGERIAAVLLLVVVPAVACASNYRFNNRRPYYLAHDYVANLLSTVQPGGMLLTLDWQVYSPMFYMREIESYRRDVVAIDINQLRRSWYFGYLDRAYPRTMSLVRAEADAFLEDLRAWEHDPDSYQRDAVRNRRISQRYHDLILALVASHSRSAPVYITQDIATFPDGGSETEWVRQIAGRYQFVPGGLVFRLYEDQLFHEPAPARLVVRGLNDGSLHFAEDDVVKLKVLPVYTGMCYNRGRYLAGFGHLQAAIQAYREALEIDPEFAPAREALAQTR